MVNLITVPLTSSGIRDIDVTENDRFAYVVTSGGVDVIELLNTCTVVASGRLPSPPTAITANWEISSGQLYIGTTASGVFSMSYHRSRAGDFTDQLVQRFSTSSAPPLLSNEINDLDTNLEGLLVSSSSGIDFIFNETEHSSRVLVSGSNNVYLTESGSGYWTTVSGNRGSVEANYDLISTTGTHIIKVDFEFSSDSDPALPAELPADIAISEKPGSFLALAFATPSGVLITEEVQFNEASARRKTLLAEQVTSVSFSNKASFETGLVYILVPGLEGLRIFDLGNTTLSGIHPQQANQAISQIQATRDQFVASGTNTIVRTTTLA